MCGDVMDNVSHSNTKNGTILFSDLKDFTLKTSLLTQKQIDKILDDQDKLMILNLKKYNGELVKTIGDSYMIFFDDSRNALMFAIEVQKLLRDYNKNKKIPLYKIEIKMSIDYGVINRKSTINGYDFFGDSVNLASRLLSRTPENKIFITDNFYNNLTKEGINCRYDFLGKTTFKGILREVGVYEIIYDENDIASFDEGKYKKYKIQEILEDDKTKRRCKNIDDIIFKCSCINCVISTQPFPFIDVYSSIGVYTYMLKSIASEYEIKLSKKQINEIILTILSALGSVLAINQAIQGFSKIGLVGLAGFLFVSLNFGVTYGVGKVLSYYFYSRSNNLKLNNSEIREIFLSGKDFGMKYAKENKKEILEIGKKFKDEFLNFKNKKSKEEDKKVEK